MEQPNLNDIHAHTQMATQDYRNRLRNLVNKLNNEELATLGELLLDCGKDPDIAWLTLGYLNRVAEDRQQQTITPEAATQTNT